MFITNKKVGETPLEMLRCLRIEKPELKEEKLSYIGRLDPMAEGKIIVLVGEENKEYKKYLGFDKEYEAEFLIDVKTDTGDILGLIEKFDQTEIPNQKITENLEKIKSLKEQKYPWFSAKTFAGLKLFDHFKKGNTDIERPVKDVKIKNLEILEIENVPAEKIKGYIFENIKKVKGDFRQKEILDCWQKYFENSAPEKFKTFKIKILVSTGTYIRAFTDEFDFPTTLLKLKRTDIKI